MEDLLTAARTSVGTLIVGAEMVDARSGGITDDLHEQVFQPYSRAHEAATPPASVGLGLSVARELARLRGGDVRHRRDDGWTRFELLLPLTEEALESPTSRSATG